MDTERVKIQNFIALYEAQRMDALRRHAPPEVLNRITETLEQLRKRLEYNEMPHYDIK